MTFGADPEKKRLRKKSNKQEARTAKAYNGSRQAASGAGWVRKNDVRSEDFLIECKFTENKKSYSIKFTDLRDLHAKAVQEDRIPVLQFDLSGKNYVVLTQDDFLEMVNV